MKLVSYQSTSGPRAAGLRDGSVVDLNGTDPTLPRCIKKLLALGPDAFPRIARAIAQGAPLPNDTILLPPVPKPEKIICVGLNYRDHARETGMQIPSEPVLFNKFPTAAAAPGQAIILPPASHEVDYEAELVAVIGRGGRHIAEAHALEHVAAYCCGNDVSARDWQLHKPGGQWLLGKSFDTFAPFGPYLTTADEVSDAGDLGIQLRLNGRTMQDSRTAQFIFSVAAVVSYASSVCTLAPGDVLFTGTPSGVGFARKPPVFMKAGDVVEVQIERLGVLRNTVAAG